MGTQFTKDMNIITNFLKDMDIIAALDDQPNDVGGLTAAELKAKFDEGGKAIQEYINDTLIPEVLGLDATEDARQQAEAARVAAENQRASEEMGRQQQESVRQYNENQRVTAEGERKNAESRRDTGEENRQTFEMDRQKQEEIRITAENMRNTSEDVRVSAEYTRVQQELNRESMEGKRAQAEAARVAAEQGRVTAEQARSEAESRREDAEGSRNSSEEKRNQAELMRQEAEQARTDSTTGIVSQATAQAQAAAASAQAAKYSETSALAGRDAAASAASAASVSAQTAQTAQFAAAASAESVTTMSRTAESWAVGGTGTRPGEDTDNARYWAGQAQSAAGGGVTTFNGRSGAVLPETGDYTAAMVGALPTQTGTRGQLLGFTADNVVGAVEAPQSGGKRTARFTVGTSTAGWTAADCDYLCDGVDDQVEILAAINALPANGGEVVLLDGTYEISAEMTIYNKPGVTLRGNGNGTVLRRNFDSSYTGGAVLQFRKDGCKVSHLKIDGNKAVYTAMYNSGISLYDSDGHQVDHVTVVDQCCAGVVLVSSSCNTITDCCFSGNDSAGVKLDSGMDKVVEYNLIANNVILDGWTGVYLYVGNHNVLANNRFQRQKSTAVYVQYSQENDLSILGNDIDYSGGIYAIQATSSSLLCSGNRIRVTGNGDGILIGDNSLVTGNMVTGSIRWSVDMGSKNVVTGNYLVGGTVQETGTDNVVADNITA